MIKCIDCKIKLKEQRALRCKSCASRNRWKNKQYRKKQYISKTGQKHSEETKIKISTSMKGKKAWNKGIKNSTNKYWLGKSNKNILVNHHIYLKQNNDLVMKISQGLHRSLHWKGYEYLVFLGLEKKYLKIFRNKYKEENLMSDGILHHIDCNRENNKKDNFLYLSSMAIHNKLHQEAYEYLIKIGKIEQYITWFFLKEKKPIENFIFKGGK